MVEYRKIKAFEESTSENGDFLGYTFKIAKLATPKNVLDAATFNNAFTAALEKRQADDIATMLANTLEDDKSEVDYLEWISVLGEYQAAIKTAAYDVLSDDDKRFIENLVYAVCGMDKRNGNIKYEFNGGAALVDEIAAAATTLLENGKITDYKPLKTALEEWTNNRLKTTNESGIFKAFKCRFTDEMCRNVVVSAIQKYKWSKSGITRGDMKKAINGVCQQVLLVALAKTFDFDAAAKNADKTTTEFR